MAIQRVTLVWTGADGNQQLRSIRTLAGAATIAAQLEVYSNAVISEAWEGDDVVSGATPATTPYLSVINVAYLTFTDGAGHNSVLALPAPKTSIFNADGQTVSALAIGPLIAACVGSLETAANTVVTAFVSGTLGKGFISGSPS